MHYNKIKDVLFKRGGLNHAIVMAMHTTESFKYLKDEAVYLENARTLLRDELLSCYAFLDKYDLFEIYLDDRDGIL
ncbi:hypothetical protein [Butyrivibrio sp. FC2001]|uniref:hypothetical protein n=1 Tax=Butyrivibrio sp. FC2001 TaxID=1280671 RepID=UPI0012DF181A|nr:hypothetical protein [Butyrivibrio sp. FC2001]